MKLSELISGRRVRITVGHHVGKTGRVITIGTFEPYGPIKALIDIGEPLLIRIEPEHLEPAPEDPLLPGWGEFEV